MWMLKFADGTAFEARSCSASGVYLWLEIVTDMSFLQLATFLANTEATSVILYYVSGKEDTAQKYEGFTSQCFEQITPQGTYLAALRKPEV